MNIINFRNIKKIMCAVLAMFASQYVLAISHDIYTIDVYRSKQITSAEVDSKYGKQLHKIASIIKKSTTVPGGATSKEMNANIDILMNGLMKSGEYEYINLSPITYAGDSKIGLSVDVVDKADSSRMKVFLPKPTDDLPDPEHLLKHWASYELYGFQQFYRTRKNFTYKECPAFHCVFGFEDPAVKKYGVEFNQKVPVYKDQLVAVLRHDKSEEKRGAAAYLLAHLKSGDEVIALLTPSIFDSSSLVRNNVMRVLAQTVLMVKNPVIDKEVVIKALDFPATVDRNKALYLMSSLVEHPQYANYLKSRVCYQVVEQLKLDQENLHNSAYVVLVRMTGLKYSDKDIQSWERWARESCPQQYKS